jgi:hypothetical protein
MSQTDGTVSFGTPERISGLDYQVRELGRNPWPVCITMITASTAKTGRDPSKLPSHQANPEATPVLRTFTTHAGRRAGGSRSTFTRLSAADVAESAIEPALTPEAVHSEDLRAPSPASCPRHLT